MASMASMVAEGGGGEQVTPDKAMQMFNAAPGRRQLMVLARWAERVHCHWSQTQRSAMHWYTDQISVSLGLENSYSE